MLHDSAAAKFSAANDAAKSDNFCGDAVYLEALLDAFGFDDDVPITMTNKIKSVELVWTLGAMLAKSAELAAAAGAVAHEYATNGEDIRIDVILLAPGAPPRHIANAWMP